jgi:hypothetical protein
MCWSARKHETGNDEMPLMAPSYIPAASQLMTYAWSEFGWSRYYQEDEKLSAKLDDISYWGVLAFSIGCAEWIGWRFYSHTTDPILLLAAQASWLAMIDWSYLPPIEDNRRAPKSETSKDNVSGPQCAAFHLLADATNNLREGGFLSSEAASLAQLAQHVWAGGREFIRWRKICVDRLIAHFSFDEANPMGAVVSPKVLDPEYDLAALNASAQLHNILHSKDLAQNPFVELGTLSRL